jgi:cyanophycinase-like exopeptidase
MEKLMLFAKIAIMQCRRAAIGLLIGIMLTGVADADNAKRNKPYDYFVTGNPDAPVNIATPPSTSSFVLMGGGPDVNEAFRWMIARAGVTSQSGGRFVILRATGTDAYDPYIYYSNDSGSTKGPIDKWYVGGASMGLSSVETLILPSREAAEDAEVNRIVGNANAVFIAGGDQSDYIKYWKGTTLDDTLRNLVEKNVPIGGTSAGLAVLGEYDFSALNGGVTSDQALADPYNKYVTLDPNPLASTQKFIAPPELADTITDAHLQSRNRMGRLITFVARLVRANGSFGCDGGVLPAGTAPGAARGIGIEVETALLVQGNGNARPVTARMVTNPPIISQTKTSAVYFVQPLNPPNPCKSGIPLTMRNVQIKRLADPDTVFNLSDWTTPLPVKIVDVDTGELTTPNVY